HVRRHGRHQHGARRNDHAWRLHHVCRAADIRRLSAAGLARHLSCHLAARGVPGDGRARHRLGAQRHPFPLCAAARDAAGDLGRQLHPATTRPHDLRRAEQSRRQPELDDQRVRADRRRVHHLQPAGHSGVLLRRAGRARPGAEAHQLWVAHARRDAESRYGGGDGDSDRADRRADVRPRLGHRRHGGRRAVADRQCKPQSRHDLHRRQFHGRRVRRRRQPVRHARRRHVARHRQQTPRARLRRGAGQGRGADRDHPVHPAPTARPVRVARPRRRELTMTKTRLFDRNGWIAFLGVGLILIVGVPFLNILPSDSPAHLADYLVPLFGKYACYALLALALDLVWGYAGILSLGHGAFFALGGYAMGMYLMRQIGTRGVYQNPILPDFMVFLNWKELPWYWYGFDHFAFAALMIVLVPGVLAFVFGWLAFRSRVTGVYLSIITQALTYALWLAFFRNDMGFGGNNGMTDFKDLLGMPLQSGAMHRGLYIASVIALGLGFLVCRYVVTS